MRAQHFITTGYIGSADDFEALMQFAEDRGMCFVHGSTAEPEFEGWPARADRFEQELERAKRSIT